MNGVSTFWDEEKQRSELRYKGWVLYADNRTTMEVMAEIHRLINTSTELRLHINEIMKTVHRAADRAIAP